MTNITPRKQDFNTLKLVSINAQGLNIPEKRSQILTLMKKHKADIVLIQETHFQTDLTPKSTNHFFPSVYHATNDQTKNKGVSILIAKHLPIKITDTLVDSKGRYLFLKGNLYNKPITIANIYCLNTKQTSFINSISSQLSTFKTGFLIVGGDLNVPLQPMLETSTGTTSIPYQALKRINLSIQEPQVHDTWRTLNPNTHDYTHLSHRKYSRLDYLFLSQSDLHLLTNSTIEPAILSDHNPITIIWTIPIHEAYTKI